MTVEERRMPYTEYPIYYNSPKLGYVNRKLYAQTLESSAFSDYSYGYFTSEKKSVFNPTATFSPVPLAPWGPFDSSDISARRWGLNKEAILGTIHYLEPGLRISTYSSSKAVDIALAGTRPVNFNSLNFTISPTDFYPNGTGSGATQYSAIDIVIYVSREEGNAPPILTVERQYFKEGFQEGPFFIPDKTVIIYSEEIPDVPYFVFNFAVCAPGAPSTDTRYEFKDGSFRYLNPGGGSGAGAQFTAILSTKPVDFDSVQGYVDKITIRYTLAKQSYSSSSAGFNPSSISSNGSYNGIDVVKVMANLHYVNGTIAQPRYYPYLRECTLPGGLVYPGFNAAYSDRAKTIINNFNSNKDAPELVSSNFNMNVLPNWASALIFHKANWMLPDPESFLTNTKADLPRYQLSQPFTAFNPEARFPFFSVTKIGKAHYTGAAGRPSIIYDGASPIQDGPELYQASAGRPGAGGSGAIWNSVLSPKNYTADGGPFTVVLSW